MTVPDRISDSPNFTPLPVLGTHVMIHATRSGKSGNPNELEGTLSWFKTGSAAAGQPVSAQWVIDYDGTKVRVILDDWQAWHAGEHNAVAFGIEICQGVESDGFTDEQLNSLVVICKGYMAGYDIPPVFDPDMTGSGFLGHEDSPQGRRAGKSDPGIEFPWADFLARLRGEEEDMITGVYTKPGTNRNYIPHGGKLVHIPNAEARLGLLKGMSHGANPPEPVNDERTWAFLTETLGLEVVE